MDNICPWKRLVRLCNLGLLHRQACGERHLSLGASTRRMIRPPAGHHRGKIPTLALLSNPMRFLEPHDWNGRPPVLRECDTETNAGRASDAHWGGLEISVGGHQERKHGENLHCSGAAELLMWWWRSSALLLGDCWATSLSSGNTVVCCSYKIVRLFFEGEGGNP